ncbi:hypothetical protein [Pseudorhodobacter sp.]|uniref:hypothetical protein n=1 Tax=Pseudorhodobacter sp. TaxID=1934400 RepID=UPI0026473208|nr:hypothetical protein [Pseudorhodobacter sp.]MDN5786525.1 hypothetical protein [Pseudorhodobacter sp.]
MTSAFDQLLPAQQAGILCADQMFRRFAAERAGLPGQAFAVSAAAEYLRKYCQIDSRRDLNTIRAARVKFDHLRTEFDAWRGKIPTQR